MTVCPVALAVGCKKCVIFGICPLKSVIGDQAAPPAKAKPAGNSRRRRK